MRWWSAYFLYFFGMGAIGVACAQVGGHLTRKVAVSLSEAAGKNSRALSRVEQRAKDQAQSLTKVAYTPVQDAAPLVIKSAVHPAKLAAAMDRVEHTPAIVPAAIPDHPATVAPCESAACAMMQSPVQLSSEGKPMRVASLDQQKVRAVASKRSARKAVIAPANSFVLINQSSRAHIRVADTPGEMVRRSLLGTS